MVKRIKPKASPKPSSSPEPKLFISPEGDYTGVVLTSEKTYGERMSAAMVKTTIEVVGVRMSAWTAGLGYSALYLSQFGNPPREGSPDPEDPSWLVGKRVRVRIKYKVTPDDMVRPDILILPFKALPEGAGDKF